MRKKLQCIVLAAVFLSAMTVGCSGAQLPKETPAIHTAAGYPHAMEYPPIGDGSVFSANDLAASVSSVAVTSPPAEVRAVWISYLEFERILTKKSASSFTSSIQKMFDNIKGFGLNTVIVQVRPFADALYKSSYFPWSHLVTGAEGNAPSFDPLKIMTAEAKARGLRIEAWINPYRIRPEGRKNGLSRSKNKAMEWISQKDDSVVIYNGIISYNPASAKAQDLIVNGAVEIVKNYDIDGIHFDDYFYPTTDGAFDENTYNQYLNNGGSLGLSDWRRANVETLIKKMYNGIKKANPRAQFGISPQSSVYNNYNAHYLDVEKIASTSGFCDYICPQIYFGYDNKTQPFQKTLNEWEDMVTARGVKLYVGLAAYKCGVVDTWAGEAGKYEWVNNDSLLTDMTKSARKADSYGGVVLYRYDSLFNPAANVAAAAKSERLSLSVLF